MSSSVTLSGLVEEFPFVDPMARCISIEMKQAYLVYTQFFAIPAVWVEGMDYAPETT